MTRETYQIRDPYQLGDPIGIVTDAVTGRVRAAYRNDAGKLYDVVIGEPLCGCCDEPADLCQCNEAVARDGRWLPLPRQTQRGSAIPAAITEPAGIGPEAPATIPTLPRVTTTVRRLDPNVWGDAA